MFNISFPSSWKIISLKGIAKVNYGKKLSNNDKFSKGSFPIYSSGGEVGFTNSPLIKSKGIVIGRVGTAGSVFYINEPFWCMYNAFYIEEISSSVELEFLAFLLEFLNLKRLALAVGVPSLNRSELIKQKIPLPTLPEQKEIVKILQQAERLKELRKIADAKYHKLKAALFNKLFGEPFQNEKNWKTTLLGDVLTETPKDGPHESPDYEDTGIPFLSTRNIKPGKIIWEDLKHISRANAEKYWKKTKPEVGDILYTKGGTTGYAKVIDFEKEIAIWVHLALLKPDSTRVDSIWLEQMLNTGYCYVQSQKLTRGVTNKDLGLQRMVKIKIILPPLSLQKQFAEIVKQIDTISTSQQVSESKIDKLASNLQIQAFTGKLTESFRQKESFAISTYARQRDEALEIKSTSDTVEQLEKTTEALENIISYLSVEQKEILDNLEKEEGYALAENGFRDLDLLANQIQRNLDLLAEIGLIKSVNIPMAPGEIGNVFFTSAYRSLKAEDNTKEIDLENLAQETNI